MPLFSLCTELMLSKSSKLTASGLPNPTPGGGTIFPGSRPVHGYHTFVLVIECLLTRLLLFLKYICIYYLQSVFHILSTSFFDSLQLTSGLLNFVHALIVSLPDSVLHMLRTSGIWFLIAPIPIHYLSYSL